MGNIKNSVRGDKIVWIVIVLLSLISLIAVYSSSSSLAYREGKTEFFFLLKQMRFVIIGLVILWFCHRLPLGLYRKWTPAVYYASVLLLLLTILFGTTLNDGTRWIKIFGYSFQPSEFAKIALILYTAKVVENGRLQKFKDYLLRLFLPLSLGMLLIFWGGISTALLVFVTVVLLLFVARTPLKYLGSFMAIAAVCLSVIIGISFASPAFPRVKTGFSRLVSFVDKDSVTDAKDFQARQAKIAVASGGVIGKLPGNSTQRYVLPHPYSDFIFSIIVEETGVAGGFAVIFLYLCLFYRFIVILKGCSKAFSALSVAGLGIMIVLQAMVHICVNVGLLPVTGQTLPLVSLGGTSIVATSIAFGIILCISRTVMEERQEAVAEAENLKKELI